MWTLEPVLYVQMGCHVLYRLHEGAGDGIGLWTAKTAPQRFQPITVSPFTAALPPQRLGASASPSPAGMDEEGPLPQRRHRCCSGSDVLAQHCTQLLSSGLRGSRPSARWTLLVRTVARWDPTLVGLGQRRLGLEPWASCVAVLEPMVQPQVALVLPH